MKEVAIYHHDMSILQYNELFCTPQCLAQSSLPDKFTSKSRSYRRNSDGEKDRELSQQRRDFSLCKALRRYGHGLAMWRYLKIVCP